jgi:DNA-3-methyladenine glycosylase
MSSTFLLFLQKIWRCFKSRLFCFQNCGILRKRGDFVAKKLGYEFYHRPCLVVAEALVGKILVRQLEDGTQLRLRITETESYCGEADTACHAHKGRTKRTDVMYMDAGTIYVYLCYGMHWILNIVTGETDEPEAVLIRACLEKNGPGKLTKALQITGNLNRGSILGDELWVEDDGFACQVVTDKRVGIGYASQEDQNRLWRFKMELSNRPV